MERPWNSFPDIDNDSTDFDGESSVGFGETIKKSAGWRINISFRANGMAQNFTGFTGF